MTKKHHLKMRALNQDLDPTGYSDSTSFLLHNQRYTIDESATDEDEEKPSN